MSHVKYQTLPHKSFFNELFNVAFEPVAYNHRPAANILETGTGYKIEVAAPGLAKEDFEIKLDKNKLTVSAKKENKQEDNTAKYRRREFVFQSFERSFFLPETIDTDNVKAAFNNGILEIELFNKPELQPAVKSISVA